MQAPPPFPNQNARTPNKTLSTALIIISVCCIVICAFGGFAMWKGFAWVKDQMMPLVVCTADAELVRDAIVDYAKDKGTFPPAENWQEAVKPYYLEREKTSDSKDLEDSPFKTKRMDPDGAWGCTLPEGHSTGFAYNKDIAGKKYADIKNTDTTVAMFEVPTIAKNQALSYTPLPRQAYPKFQGEFREYIVGHITGEIKGGLETMGGSKGKAKVKFSSKSSSDD